MEPQHGYVWVEREQGKGDGGGSGGGQGGGGGSFWMSDKVGGGLVLIAGIRDTCFGVTMRGFAVCATVRCLVPSPFAVVFSKIDRSIGLSFSERLGQGPSRFSRLKQGASRPGRVVFGGV